MFVGLRENEFGSLFRFSRSGDFLFLRWVAFEILFHLSRSGDFCVKIVENVRPLSHWEWFLRGECGIVEVRV